MLERIEKELGSLAKRLGMENDEMNEKYAEIATSNGLDVDDERQSLVALTLTRNYAVVVLPVLRTPEVEDMVIQALVIL